jgi:cobyrinic acid a,c-diamide synthase
MVISAPASGHGKTTVTAALARLHRRQVRQVRVFKVGPDFLDPTVLARASGHPVYQLDLWMCGDTQCRALLWQAAATADLILIEGVMGLYDGAPSTADLAALFGLPVLAVIDASAMAETFGAVVAGLAGFRTDVRVLGALANRVAGEAHARMVAASVKSPLQFCGALPMASDCALPERHLGLVPADELPDLEQRLDSLGVALARTALSELPQPVTFTPASEPSPPQRLDGVRIGIARDAAFSFLYQANLDLLHDLGAELHFFSPLADRVLPEVDALYFPGGYPELHSDTLAGNTALHAAIRDHYHDRKKILAECGGMLYLLDALTDRNGRTVQMVGLLGGNARMQDRLVALALQVWDTPAGDLRGHTFHYSRADAVPVHARTRCPNGSAATERVFQQSGLTVAYVHFYFPSNPAAVAKLFSPAASDGRS